LGIETYGLSEREKFDDIYTALTAFNRRNVRLVTAKFCSHRRLRKPCPFSLINKQPTHRLMSR